MLKIQMKNNTAQRMVNLRYAVYYYNKGKDSPDKTI